jgi:hypothetical protein
VTEGAGGKNYSAYETWAAAFLQDDARMDQQSLLGAKMDKSGLLFNKKPTHRFPIDKNLNFVNSRSRFSHSAPPNPPQPPPLHPSVHRYTSFAQTEPSNRTGAAVTSREVGGGLGGESKTKPTVAFVIDISTTMMDGHRLELALTVMMQLLSKNSLLCKTKAAFEMVTYQTSTHSWVQGQDPATQFMRADTNNPSASLAVIPLDLSTPPPGEGGLDDNTRVARQVR